MPDDANDQLWPSLLDRIMDRDDQYTGLDFRKNRPKALAYLRRVVQRDLEWLLNTKHTLIEGPLYGELSRSLLTYGLPDVTSVGLGDPRDRARLAKAIEDAIARFEPRLIDVKVRLQEAKGAERALRFRIEGKLVVDPAPEPVSFGTVLQLANKNFEVTEEG